MRKTPLVAITTGLAAGLALAGCTGAAVPTGPGASGAGDQATVQLWDYLGTGVGDTAMKALIKQFEDKNPGIKIKRTSFAYDDLGKSIIKGGVGGQVPDVAIIANADTQNFANLGLLEDITASSGSKSSQFFPGAWASTQLSGKTYALPLNVNNLALYYNKDLFTAAGQTPPTTWDELRATAKALTNKDHTGLAISAVKNEQGTFQFLPFLWQTGGDLKTYATDGATALGFLKGLIDDGSMSKAVVNFSQEDARTQFAAGKTAMMINGPWELAGLATSGINFGVAPLAKGKVAATSLGGENAVAFSASKNKEAAAKFLDYMTGAEGAALYCNESGQLSARPDLAGKLKSASDPNIQVFDKQSAVARARAYGANYPEISAAVQDSLQKVLTGAATPEQAAQQAATIITAKLG